jgi:hypothetical protein
MKKKIKGKKAYSNDLLTAYLLENVESNSSLLDVGCGPKLYSTPFIGICKSILTIDAWDWVEPDIVANLETDNIQDVVNNEKFDYVLMLDFIEHLDKAAGLKLIEDCKKICNKKIFLLTPLEEIWTDNHENVEDESLWCYGNKFDIHKSLWYKTDFDGWTEITVPGFENYYIGSYSCEK